MTQIESESFALRTYGKIIRNVYNPHVVYLSKNEDNIINKPHIIIANHQSFADSPMVFMALHKNEISFITAEKLHHIPFIRKVLAKLDCIKIKQNASQTAWFKQACAKLKAGKSVLIYPEGHINYDGEMSKFQPGFAMLAAATGAPILPVFIKPGYRPFNGPTGVYIGEYVILEKPSMNSDYLRNKTEMIQKEMQIIKEKAKSFGKLDKNNSISLKHVW